MYRARPTRFTIERSSGGPESEGETRVFQARRPKSSSDKAHGRHGHAGNGATRSRYWKESMDRCIGVPTSRAGGRGAFLYDRFGRRVDYLRLSVTDRCNLRCSYCMPKNGVPWVRREDVLTWEELFSLSWMLAESGVRKIRVTGGEPLARSGVTSFLSRLRLLPGSPEIALTTNATLLEEHLARIVEAGISRVNVSLDTLRADKFRRLTGRDLFDRAWRAVGVAHGRGLAIKLNVVVLAGVNDDEILDFVSLTKDRDITVRFIEAMRFADLSGGPRSVVDGETILDRIREKEAIEKTAAVTDAVEELYQIPGSPGRVGVIRGHTRTFCNNCSRLRINALGKLRTCLYAQPSLDLRALLRSGAKRQEIRRLIHNAVRGRHLDGWEAQASLDGEGRGIMSRIGG